MGMKISYLLFPFALYSVLALLTWSLKQFPIFHGENIRVSFHIVAHTICAGGYFLHDFVVLVLVEKKIGISPEDAQTILQPLLYWFTLSTKL